MMVSMIWQINIKTSCMKDPLIRKTVADAALCKSCGNWLHGRCAKIKKVTDRLAIDFNSSKCKGCHENIDDQKEKLHDDIETVT